MCEERISTEEVLQAISLSKRGKAPGSDGIPYEYYKQHKEELVDFMTQLFNELVELELITHSMREGVITLIFKKKGSPSDIRQYRPITLLTCDLKLFTSILARRISKVTHQICDPQNTAIPGRQISDSTMTLHVLQQMLTHEGKEGYAIFLDWEKCFDLISWVYIQRAMRALGFGPFIL